MLTVKFMNYAFGCYVTIVNYALCLTTSQEDLISYVWHGIVMQLYLYGYIECYVHNTIIYV